MSAPDAGKPETPVQWVARLYAERSSNAAGNPICLTGLHITDREVPIVFEEESGLPICTAYHTPMRRHSCATRLRRPCPIPASGRPDGAPG